jgi:hypothetical protein
MEPEIAPPAFPLIAFERRNNLMESSAASRRFWVKLVSDYRLEIGMPVELLCFEQLWKKTARSRAGASTLFEKLAEIAKKDRSPIRVLELIIRATLEVIDENRRVERRQWFETLMR